MRLISNKKATLRLDLVKIGRMLKSRLPVDEWPHYNTYLTHVGRNDVVAASSKADERTSIQLHGQTDPSVYRELRQAYSLVEKLVSFGDESARERAYAKFKDAELACKETNQKFRFFQDQPEALLSPSGVVDYALHNRIRLRVSRMLGSFRRAWPEMTKQIRFGPGMSLSSADASKTSAPFKLFDGFTTTEGFLPAWSDFLNHGFLRDWVDWKRNDEGIVYWVPRVRIVPGCRITFVPKTSVISRTIAIEPSANMVGQLAVHSYLIPRLKRFGLDLTDQSRNRALALRGSVDGSIATIDLSSASDLISFEVVRALVPDDWFEWLCALRSPVGHYGSDVITFEKFSSMGNGFTFVLESVLFYAIASEIAGDASNGLTSVYGDDIIVAAKSYAPVIEALTFYGFKANAKKSFSEGRFRESCGLDAFDGVDVRPVFVRSGTISLAQAIAFHNHCFRRSYFDVCEYIVSLTPENLRFFGPPGPEAGFFFTEDANRLERARKWSKDTQSFRYLSVREEGVRIRMYADRLLEASLFDSGSYSRGAPLRLQTKLVCQPTYRDH